MPAAAICVGLILAEVGVRVSGMGVPVNLDHILARTIEARARPPHRLFGLWTVDTRLGWRFKPDMSMPLDFVPYYENGFARTNGLGMLDTAPRAGARLVFVLGDSFVEGLSVPHERHFTTVLEGYFPARDFLNLGVSGYGTVQSYLHLQERLQQLRPERVIFAVYLGNDFDENDPYRNNSMTGVLNYDRGFIPFFRGEDIVYGEQALPFWRTLLDRSQLFLVTQRALENSGLSSPFGSIAAEALAHRIARELRGAGVAFTVLLIPSDALVRGEESAIEHDRLLESFASIHTISLLEPFRATGLKTMGYTGANGEVLDAHWTSKTHALVASEIARALRDAPKPASR